MKNQHQSYPPYRQRPPARCIRISRPINPGVSISSRFQEPSSQPATGSAHPRPRPGIAASESRPSILSGSRRAIDPRSADAQARAAQSSIMSIRSVEVHAARRGKRNCRRDPAAHRGRHSRARQPRTLPLCEALPPRAPATPGAADHVRPAGGQTTATARKTGKSDHQLRARSLLRTKALAMSDDENAATNTPLPNAITRGRGHGPAQ